MRKYPVILAAILAACLLTMADTAGAAPSTPIPFFTRPTPAPRIYVVESGDTFWHIAQAHRLSLDELAAANPNTKPAMLVVGQRLVIPVRGTLITSGSATPTPVVAPTRYVVQQGDTFWDIALRHSVTVAALTKANPLVKPSSLVVGQELRLPSGTVLKPATPTPSPTLPAPTVVITTSVALSDTVGAEQAPETAGGDGSAAAEQPQSTDTTDQSATAPEQTEGGDGSATPPAETDAATEPEATPEPAATPLPEPTPTPTLVVTNLPAEIQGWPQQVADLINELRAAEGLAPLAWSPGLAQAAQGHALDCAGRDWCSHIGSDGDRLRKRLNDVGYDAEWNSENWVYTHGPERAVRWWFNEPPGADPHRANILSRQYTEIGVGVAVGKWGLYYFVADFARP